MTTSPVNLSELTGDYILDPAHTRIGFVARHAMITKVRGYFHEFEGAVYIDGDEPSKSHATVTIKADTIDTGVQLRDDLLRGNDFLDMQNHPEIRFVSTAIEQVDETDYKVTGDLTIRGVTRPLTFNLEFTGLATDTYGSERAGFEGSVTINRKDWGVNWNAALDGGGVLIGEKVVLEFDVSAVRQR
jgi:polyisoprenoid-binding protein YceI